MTALLAVLVFGSTLAYADPVDPRIVIAGDSGSNPVGQAFIFSSNELGGGFYRLFNNTEHNWTSLFISAPSIPTDPSSGDPITEQEAYVIQSDLFWDAYLWFGENTVNILFSGTGNLGDSEGDTFSVNGNLGDSEEDTEYRPGIVGGAHFFIDLNDVPGINGGGWLSNGNQIDFSAAFYNDYGYPSYPPTPPDDSFLFSELSPPSNPVPEPGSLVLLLGGLGVLVVGIARRKR